MELLAVLFFVIGIILLLCWIFDVERGLVRCLRRNAPLVGLFFLLAVGFWLLLGIALPRVMWEASRRK